MPASLLYLLEVTLNKENAMSLESSQKAIATANLAIKAVQSSANLASESIAASLQTLVHGYDAVLKENAELKAEVERLKSENGSQEEADEPDPKQIKLPV